MTYSIVFITTLGPFDAVGESIDLQTFYFFFHLMIDSEIYPSESLFSLRFEVIRINITTERFLMTSKPQLWCT